MKRLKQNYITGILLSFLTCVQIVYAQDGLKNYMPSIAAPSPTPYSFTTYGNIPVEGNDGSFSTSIPFFSERYRDIDISVSLGYRSGGLPIDELGGIIGSSWVLNAGGAVTRVMRGIPDEQAMTRWYPSQINVSNALDYSNVVESARGVGVDTEQDWFSYNVNGLSGKFYLDADLNIVRVGGNDEKIILETTSIASSYGQVLKFTIIDAKGYRYVFGGDLNCMEGSMLTRNCFVGPKPTFQSAWFLKEIISPTNARVTFDYQEYTLDNVTSVIHNRSYSQSCAGTMLSAYKATINDCIYSTVSSTRALSKISFGNYSLSFIYDNIRQDGGGLKLNTIKLFEITSLLKSINCTYEEVLSTRPIGEPALQTSNKLKYRYFLKEIQFNGLNNAIGPKYLLEYYNLSQLPPRFSYSRDKFGYFNNMSNYSPFSSEIGQIASESVSNIFKQAGGTSFATAKTEVNGSVVHYGQLRKITYPTGGSTEILYEANKTERTTTTKEPLYHQMSAQLSCESRETVSTFRFVSTGAPTKVISSVVYDDYPNMSCTINPDPLHDLQMLTVVDVRSNTVVNSTTKKVGEVLETSFSAPIGYEYELRYKVTSKFNPLYGVLEFWYNSHDVTRTFTDYGGGSRLRSLINVSDNGKVEQRNFYYNVLNDIDKNRTTLYTALPPRYYDMSTVKIPCSGLMVETNSLRVTSSNINQLYNFRSAKTIYSAITEASITDNGETNGFIERQYNVVEDNAPFAEFGPVMYGVPYSNISEGILGKISRQKWFDSSKSLKKEQVFDYQLVQDDRNKNWVFRKNYDIVGGTNPAMDMEAGSYSAVHYFNSYVDWKLKKVTSYDYQSIGAITSDVIQEYSGTGHKQITKKTVTSSDGKSNTTEFYYAPDLIASGMAYVSDLTQQNRLNPIRIKRYLGNKLVLEETSGFGKVNNLVVLKSINKKYGPEQNRVDESVNIAQFNNYGNPLEITTQLKAPTVYLWGYGGQYPIAEIKNASYAEVESVLTKATVDLLNSPTVTDATITTAMTKLRAGLPQAMVTSYTYKPLVGMTSKTDARGIKESYTYDGMQRLQAILDHLNHVNKAFDYHYRPN